VNVAQHGGLCAVMVSHFTPPIGDATVRGATASGSLPGNLHAPLTEPSSL
jgi:hypothetical protein